MVSGQMDVVEKPVVGGGPSREPGADSISTSEKYSLYPADMRRPKLARAVLDEIDDEVVKGTSSRLRGEDECRERVPDVLEDLEQREISCWGSGSSSRASPISI
jgi:hypothetical protein